MKFAAAAILVLVAGCLGPTGPGPSSDGGARASTTTIAYVGIDEKAMFGPNETYPRFVEPPCMWARWDWPASTAVHLRVLTNDSIPALMVIRRPAPISTTPTTYAGGKWSTLITDFWPITQNGSIEPDGGSFALHSAFDPKRVLFNVTTQGGKVEVDGAPLGPGASIVRSTSYLVAHAGKDYPINQLFTITYQSSAPATVAHTHECPLRW